MHDLAFDEDRLPTHGGADVIDVEVAADSEEEPITGLVDVDEGAGGAEVEEAGRATTVESPDVVAVYLLSGEGKRAFPFVLVGGVKFQAGEDEVHPILGMSTSTSLQHQGCYGAYGGYGGGSE